MSNKKKDITVDLEEISKAYADYRMKFGNCLGQHYDRKGKQYCIIGTYGSKFKCPFLNKNEDTLVLTRDKDRLDFQRYHRCNYERKKRD